ncbi:hypothetical protein [Aminipila sp.]|uniref:hypothetical protein n=1 Tax=Aminipila sp. TaxID=2060095 RepID=UPI00289A8644|nr:hypothetical protein [Aminipila sp.]
MLKLALALMLGNSMIDQPVDMYISYCKAIHKLDNNVTTMQTMDGKFYKTVNEIQIGKEAYVVFDGKGTTDKTDDEIIFVEESNYISDWDW